MNKLVCDGVGILGTRGCYVIKRIIVEEFFSGKKLSSYHFTPFSLSLISKNEKFWLRFDRGKNQIQKNLFVSFPVKGNAATILCLSMCVFFKNKTLQLVKNIFLILSF